MHYTKHGSDYGSLAYYNPASKDVFLVPSNGMKYRVGDSFHGNNGIKVIGVTYWPKPWWKFWKRKNPRFYTIQWEMTWNRTYY